MPQPNLPPTPASSTDITGKDGTKDLPPLQMSFELPPPALASPPTEPKHRSGSLTKPEFPVQPSEAVKARRRSSAATTTAAGSSSREARGFELPPPPTRSRKIIQMKPKKDEEAPARAAPRKASGSGGGKAAAEPASAQAQAPAQAAAAGGGVGKKKQPSATSAAGRKIARKTAHSLIERRRRSKMNEEFAVLKGMIPACTGEMHKLAILQASIEYVRYLEDCVTKLKTQHNEDAVSPRHRHSHSPAHTPTALDPFIPSHNPETHHPDVEMAESTAPSPTYTAAPSHRSSVSVSPALLPDDDRRGSCSSASTDPRRYSYSTSAATSPACGPQYGLGPVSLPPIGSALASPALGPLGREADHEATAALLMLNTDRRGYEPRREEGGGEARRGSGRGMSVRDLLST